MTPNTGFGHFCAPPGSAPCARGHRPTYGTGHIESVQNIVSDEGGWLF